MTFDLMARLAEAGDLRLEKAVVTAFHDDMFHATMWVHAGGRIHKIDARPSDAFNLALRVQAPKFVEAELFGRMSQTPDKLAQDAQGYAEKTGKELSSLRGHEAVSPRTIHGTGSDIAGWERDMSDLTFKPAVELAKMLRERQIGCLELLDDYLEHFERFNPRINAIAVLDADRARERAMQADAALARGEV